MNATLSLIPRQEIGLKQHLSLQQLRTFTNLLEMTNGELFDFLKEHEGKGETGIYPMFSIEKVMTIPRHLDVWVRGGVIREASSNYICYSISVGGRKSNRALSSLAWMLKSRERMLEVATSFILRYHHEFFWGSRKHINPISIQEAVNYINGHSEIFFLDNCIEYTMFSRVLKNKVISVGNREYPMRFFFTRKKVHLHEVKKLIEEALEDNQKLSDSALVNRFHDKFGYSLARRTVNKYRRELKIPSFFERKKI